MQHEARDRDQCDADFDELQPLCDQRLVVAVGDFAAERGQEEIRRDENGTGKRDQRPAILTDQLVQNQKDERVLQKVVVERGEELRPEQRREAPRQHQKAGFRVRFFVHGSNAATVV